MRRLNLFEASRIIPFTRNWKVPLWDGMGWLLIKVRRTMIKTAVARIKREPCPFELLLAFLAQTGTYNITVTPTHVPIEELHLIISQLE